MNPGRQNPAAENPGTDVEAETQTPGRWRWCSAGRDPGRAESRQAERQAGRECVI